MATISILNGPNLNLLGIREPSIYGNKTLVEINQNLRSLITTTEHKLVTAQYNAENLIIEHIQDISQQTDHFLIINPAGLGHTSVILRDALLCLPTPFVEVHLTNTHAREEFRQKSYTMDIAYGVIAGFGAFGYTLAIKAVLNYLEQH